MLLSLPVIMMALPYVINDESLMGLKFNLVNLANFALPKISLIVITYLQFWMNS